MPSKDAEKLVASFFENSLVEVHDFKPPEGFGRGLRAKKAIKEGDTVMTVGPTDDVALLPASAKALLTKWFANDGYQKTAGRPKSLAELTTGQIVQVLSDEKEVLAACRASDIDEDNDAERKKSLGKCMHIKELDASDDTVCLENGQDINELWMPLRALAFPSKGAAIEALWREEALALCILHLRKGLLPANPVLLAWASKLPAEYDQPFLWTPEELDELVGSNYEARARREHHEARNKHSALAVALGSEVAGSQADFLHGLASVRSRVFGTEFATVRPLEGGVVMIPFIDYVNHHPREAGVKVRQTPDGNSCCLIATRDYAEGSEVFLSYGHCPSSELLMSYGFVAEPNPNTAVEIQLTLEQTRVNDPLRLKLCNRLTDLPSCEIMRQPGKDMEPMSVRILLTAVYPLPHSLLGLCRLEKVSNTSLAQLRKNHGEAELVRRVMAGEPLDKASDTSLVDLSMVFKSMLGAYPTTLQDDEALLAKNGSGKKALHRSLALSLRMEEKRILHAALDAAIARMQ